MDWDNLRYFLEVARSGTLVAAARRLGVEHTTVSRRVQALEKQMGQALFARESNQRGVFVDLDKIPDGKHIGKEILRLTSSPNMDEARNAFYNRISADARIDIILHNADSLALLICEMGRQLDPAPVP